MAQTDWNFSTLDVVQGSVGGFQRYTRAVTAQKINSAETGMDTVLTEQNYGCVK